MAEEQNYQPSLFPNPEFPFHPRDYSIESLWSSSTATTTSPTRTMPPIPSQCLLPPDYDPSATPAAPPTSGPSSSLGQQSEPFAGPPPHYTDFVPPDQSFPIGQRWPTEPSKYIHGDEKNPSVSPERVPSATSTATTSPPFRSPSLEPGSPEAESFKRKRKRIPLPSGQVYSVSASNTPNLAAVQEESTPDTEGPMTPADNTEAPPAILTTSSGRKTKPRTPWQADNIATLQPRSRAPKKKRPGMMAGNTSPSPQQPRVHKKNATGTPTGSTAAAPPRKRSVKKKPSGIMKKGISTTQRGRNGRDNPVV